MLDQSLVEEKFVPNDVLLDGDKNRLLILTGPEHGRQEHLHPAGRAARAAGADRHRGCPRAAAEIGLVDRIFTRVGASDDLSRGQSTFMVEMNETANIPNNATARSLVILDEIGRGTTTFDGLSIAWSVAEYLHDEVRARTLFATHYHELTELELTRAGVQNYNVAVREWNDQIIFLRKIVPGGADKSYGIQVARLAGLPPADHRPRQGDPQQPRTARTQRRRQTHPRGSAAHASSRQTEKSAQSRASVCGDAPANVAFLAGWRHD